MKKIVIMTAVATTLFASGVSAGTILEKYKTNRGDMATVEIERVHKNRIGLQVDGKKVEQPTIYIEDEQVTYVPLRIVAELLGTDITYNQKTQMAEIKKTTK